MIAPDRFSPEALYLPVWLLSPQFWSSRLRLPPFLPHLKGLCLAEIAATEEGVTLQLSVARRTARCPSCQRHAHRSHRRDDRTIADLPWRGTTVGLWVRVRRSVCRVAACPQCIFTERLPQLVGCYARRTHRLRDALQQLGLALGGAAGAQLATLLCLIRSMFRQNQAVILCLAGRQEQGSQN